MSARPQLSILVLGDDVRSHADTLLEHLAAFGRYSRHRVDYYNPRSVESSRHLNLSAYDVVVIHYSLAITFDAYLSPAFRDQIRRYAGLKVQLLQDEYRWVEEVTATMRDLGIDVLLSIVPEEEIDAVYGGRLPDTEILPTLAGYVPENLASHRAPPIVVRPIDIGYRGRVLPFWNGRLSQEKVWIAQGVLERIEGTGLTHDIAWGESDRIYGKRWTRFLTSCRTTLGAESGTSITDFDGSIEAAVRDYLGRHPEAGFDEVSREVLGPHEGNVMMNVVSPRLFEAAALRTAMILFPGHYGGTVQPWDHYVPLEKDFSNFDEVVEAVRDVPMLQAMAERARAEVVDSGRYSLRSFVAGFDDIVETRVKSRGTGDRSALRRARLERVRRTRTVAGYDPRPLKIAAAQAFVLARLLGGDRRLRRLTRVLLADATFRRNVGLTRLANDVLRLGILRRAQAGDPVVHEQFAVACRTHPDGALTFVSRPDADIGDVPDAHGLGANRTVLWDHRQVGEVFHFEWIRGRLFSFGVGLHGVPGIHQFGTFPAAARAGLPELEAAIEPLTSAPAARRPRRPPHPVVVALGVALRPRNYLGKAYLLARLLLRRPRLRALAVDYAREPALRAATPPKAFIRDLVKLYVVQEASRARVPGVHVCADAHDGVLTFRSTGSSRNGAPPSEPPASLERVVWEHEHDLAVNVPVWFHPRLVVSVGPEGTHEFDALVRLHAERPLLTWRALTDLA